MKNNNIENELRKLNRKDKENLLKFLVNLELQGKSNNQVPAVSFLQKDG